MTSGQLQKLVGSTLQTVIACESLDEDLQFSPDAMFVTKDEVIYVTDSSNQRNRILRINPAESLEPVVVAQLCSDYDGPNLSGLWGLFVTEGGTIYVADHDSGKVLAFHPGETTPTEVLQLPDALHPTSLLVQGKSLYVSAVDNYDSDERAAGGVYEYFLPPELQIA